MRDLLGLVLAWASYGSVYAAHRIGPRRVVPIARAVGVATFAGASFAMASDARGLTGGVLVAALAWTLAASLLPVVLGAARG